MCGNNDYLMDLVQVYHMLNKYKNWVPKMMIMAADAVAFVQAQQADKVNKERQAYAEWKKKADCHECGKIGHIKAECPDLKDDNDSDTRTPRKRNHQSPRRPRRRRRKRKRRYSSCKSWIVILTTATNWGL